MVSEVSGIKAGATPTGGGFLRIPLNDIHAPPHTRHARSEERRVGKECRSRWSPYH